MVRPGTVQRQASVLCLASGRGFGKTIRGTGHRPVPRTPLLRPVLPAVLPAESAPRGSFLLGSAYICTGKLPINTVLLLIWVICVWGSSPRAGGEGVIVRDPIHRGFTPARAGGAGFPPPPLAMVKGSPPRARVGRDLSKHVPVQMGFTPARAGGALAASRSPAYARVHPRARGWGSPSEGVTGAVVLEPLRAPLFCPCAGCWSALAVCQAALCGFGGVLGVASRASRNRMRRTSPTARSSDPNS